MTHFGPYRPLPSGTRAKPVPVGAGGRALDLKTPPILKFGSKWGLRPLCGQIWYLPQKYAIRCAPRGIWS